jgi:hypothetical protein
MKSLLLNVDGNVPKEKKFFKKIEDDRIRDRCNFKKICNLTCNVLKAQIMPNLILIRYRNTDFLSYSNMIFDKGNNCDDLDLIKIVGRDRSEQRSDLKTPT